MSIINKTTFRSLLKGYWLMLILKGMITGIAGMLPGFSGGVMMLVFGLYEPLMETLAHPRVSLKRNLPILTPFVLGIGLGFWLTARVMADVFNKYALQATCLFIGLIVGMIPALFKEASAKGRPKGTFIWLILSTIIPLSIFEFLKFSHSISVVPNLWWFLFSGVLWGVSLIVPGMSSSSLLMFLNLYIPLNNGIGNFDFFVILPWIFGIAATVLVLSRLVNYIFNKYYSIAHHCVIGIVFATTVIIIPIHYGSMAQLFFCMLIAVLGFLLSFGINILNKKFCS
ncbi:MAG: DUF368 domain-containing protein [Bacillota bacterium]|nr:DUF368 domain-containing protein [Bacillota bacterium]